MPTGTMFSGTEVGGLSGITYDPVRDLYYAVSDDRSNRNPARFYHITADMRDGLLDPGDVSVTAVVTLTDDAGEPFAAGSVDPEGIALSSDDWLFVSSEGDVAQGVAPFVRAFSLTGRQRDEIPLPEAWLPDVTGPRGVRDNLALESVAVSPDGRSLHTGTESALTQDAPTASVQAGSPSRILNFDLERWMERGQQVYPVAPIPVAPEPPTGLAQNGLIELAVLDDFGSLLALERAAVAGHGLICRLFESRTTGEVDVRSRHSLTSAVSGAPLIIQPAPVKRLVADIGALGIVPDNLEGMALGPLLPDGKRFLLLVSDNNFSALQSTQFVGLALTLARAHVVGAIAETPPQLDVASLGAPAIWHDPQATGETRLVAARGGSGLAQLGLDGRLIAAVPVASVPSAVALIPRFFDDDANMALVVTTSSDAYLRFQVTSRVPPDFHSVNAPDPTMPFPDRPATDPLGPVAAFAQPGSGAHVIVAEGQGNQLAQLRLRLAQSGGVYGEVLRTLEIPVAPGSESRAVVVGVGGGDDGNGYVAVRGEGVYSFALDPAAGGDVAKIYDLSVIGGEVGGLSWLTLPDVGPVLLVSRPSDGSLVVLDVTGHRVLGEFVVGAAGQVDAADRPVGVNAMGGDLGATATDGLILVVDAMDDPQDVAEVDGRLVNRAWNVKIAPWSAALLTAEPVDPPTPATPVTPAASATPRSLVSAFIPSAAKGR